MKIEFKALTISGFKSFAAPQTFTFPVAPGLYFLTGRNELNPEISPNAVGKSTVWDALLWCLAGKTARGARAGNAANRGREHPCRVVCEFNIDGTRYAVTRTWGPNALTLSESGNPRTVVQDDIDQLLGFNYEGLCRTLVLGQFGEYFFDLPPAEKLHVFAAALDLDYWLAAAKRAADAAKKAETTLTGLFSPRQKLAKLEGQLGADRHYLENVVVREKAWAEEQERRIDGKRLALRTERELLAECARELAAAEAGKETSILAYLNGKEIKGRADAVLRRLEKDRTEGERTAYHCKEKLDAAFVAYSVFCRNKGRCPACGNALPPDKVAAEEKRLKDEIIRLEPPHAEAFDLLGEATALLESGRDAAKDADAELGILAERVVKAREKLAKVREQHKAQEKTAEGVQRQLREAKDAVNPHAQNRLTVQSRLADGAAQSEVLREEIKTLETTQSDAAFWADEFRKLRLWLIEEALLEFEVETNAVLPALGLDGWRVKYDIARENKNGNVTREFVVVFTAPAQAEPADWTTFSGGETQRLRIAGAAGLLNFLCSRAGVWFNAEVWDEPSAHLNEGGIDNLLNYLDDRATAMGKQVWLVDHRSLNAGDFAGTVKVIKDKNGSRFEGDNQEEIPRRPLKRVRIN